jgi:hypothetical protein
MILSVFLPGDKIIRSQVLGRATAMQCGFRVPDVAAVLCGSWMAVGYDRERDAFCDVSLAAADLAGMITWECAEPAGASPWAASGIGDADRPHRRRRQRG